MQTKTYTVLVTITAHEKAPTCKDLANAIQQGLEEGTTDHRSQSCATVDAFEGDRLTGSNWGGQMEAIGNARALHIAVAAD